METTIDEMCADYYAHTFYDDPKAAEEVIDEDFDADDVARQIGAPDLSPDNLEELI